MPVDLPLSAFASIDAPPNLGVAMARTEGGLVITSRKSDPFWAGRLTTGPLDPRGTNERARFLAWLVWAADNNMRVDIVHPRHRVPQAYQAGGWPMVGNAALVSTPNLRTLNVSGVPVGTILKRSDRVSVLQGDMIVHRWLSSDLVVASTLNQTIPITPRLPIGVLAPGAAVVLKDPKLRAIIVPGSWGESAAEEYGPSAISFDIVEALR